MAQPGRSDSAAAEAESSDLIDSKEISIIEEIGDGVTSTVFRGICRGMVVAVKEMNYNPESMPTKARVNLEREIMILRKVNHPCLVKFIGVAQGSKIKLVTEFCAGGTAFDLLHNDGVLLSWDQKMKIATDVSSAMEYLHECDPPIIHRDLKSLNLLLQQPVVGFHDVPMIKVTDFGLSRVMADTTGDAVMTKNAGTCHWMAPEVFTENKYKPSVDVYSYGMILFEVIYQDIPFGDVQASKLGLLVVKGQRPNLEKAEKDKLELDLGKEAKDCPTYILLRDLMVHCWLQTPEHRPSFSQIQQALFTGDLTGLHARLGRLRKLDSQ